MASWIDQLIILIGGVVLGALPAYFITKHFSRGKLVYSISQILTLIETKTDFRENLEIRYKGKKVGNLSAIQIKFKNISSRPIKRDEMRQGCFEIKFQENIEVVDWNFSTSSERMEVYINHMDSSKKNVVGIDIDFLDKNEFLIVNLLCKGSEIKKPEIIAEIAGVDIEEYPIGVPSKKSILNLIVSLILALSVVVMALLAIITVPLKNLENSQDLSDFIMIPIILLFFGISIYGSSMLIRDLIREIKIRE